MQKILGLDIGANSIGWVLLCAESEKSAPQNVNKGFLFGAKILGAGVRLFPAGKEAFNSPKEKSPNVDRGNARRTRRLLTRRKLRKGAVRQILQENGLLPLETCPLEKDKTDPLALRAKGLDEKLTLLELGRAIYHINERRGFKSVRKTAVKVDKPQKKVSNESANENDDSGTSPAANAAKKDDKLNILKNIQNLETKIAESGKRTLGEYLWSLRKESKDERIRTKHTRRSMYEKEFTLLWQKQSEFHSELTEELKQKLVRQIFFVRSIYWKQSSIGKCEFEKNEHRCQRADRAAQEFRFYQEMNNLEYVDQKNKLCRVVEHKDFVEFVVEKAKKSKSISFDEIRKLLGLDNKALGLNAPAPVIRFNLETGKKKKGNSEVVEYRKELKGFETDYVLSRPQYFDKAWYKIPDGEKNEIVRILLEKSLSQKMIFDKKGRAVQMSEEELRNYIAANWQTKYALTDEQVDNLTDSETLEKDLPKGTAGLSRKAYLKMLPFMRQGCLYSGTQNKDGSYDDALHQAGYKRPDEEDDWVVFTLLPKLGYKTNVKKGFLELAMINNPVVRRIVNETRLLVNAIIGQYGRPDKIHIELARDAKASPKERSAISKKNRENRDEREAAKAEIEHHTKATHDAILRYRLWKQQKFHCVYTGQAISVGQLLSGEVDIDHILPLSRSSDDSQMNKVVVFRKANAEKGQKTPYEWLHNKPEQYAQVKLYIKDLPFPKRMRFELKELDEDEFTQRQLNDTKYASRYMMNYLRCIFTPDEWKAERRILTVKGVQTSDLRHFLGLDTILHSSDFISDEVQSGEKDKNRGDHRHHAVDALCIALTDTKMLKRLSVYKEERQRGTNQNFPIPWATFRLDAETAINDTVVAHRPKGRARGQLHEQSNYGATYKPNEEKTDANRILDEYVIRKELTALSAAEFFKIRDDRIRQLVFARLAQFGIVPKVKSAAIGTLQFDITPAQQKEAFAKPLYMPPKNGILPPDEKDRAKYIIKKVRIVKSDKSVVPLRDDKTIYVKPGSTHHICLFEEETLKSKGSGKNKTAVPIKKRISVFVTRLEANKRLLYQKQFLEKKRKELGLTAKEAKQNAEFNAYRSWVLKEFPLIQKYAAKIPAEKFLDGQVHPNAKFLFSLKQNEMFIVKDGGTEKLVAFRGGHAVQGTFRFEDIRDARKEPKGIFKSGESYNDIIAKVCVDRLGNIQSAKD
ncbi:hypothetical protein FACS1894170_06320 [Planctomycetales bacterium]|nr:hypothetical protein FACS1894170_06320 [Planctomycetales bacterium]